MENYNFVKLRSYLIHLTAGALIGICGAGVLYSIVTEMIQMYDVKSKYAYICGIIAAAVILLTGIYFLVKAFGFDRQVLKKLSFVEREQFFKELEDERTLFFGRCLFITRNFIVIIVKSWDPHVQILKIDDLVGCFGIPYYASSDELVQYDIVLCDRDFHLYKCVVRGKKAGMMEEAWKAVCSYAPWVFCDDYMDFVSGLTKKSKKRSYQKIVDHRRNALLVSEDTIQDAQLSAADVIKAFNDKKNSPVPQKSGEQESTAVQEKADIPKDAAKPGRQKTPRSKKRRTH